MESVNKHRKEPFPAELQFSFVRMSCVHYGKKHEQKWTVHSAYRLQAKDGGFVAAAPVTNAYIQTNKILT